MKFAKSLWMLLLGLSGLKIPAQHYVFSNDIPVAVNGQQLRCAWAGGLNAPQFSAIDLDNDGRLDLAIFDRVGPRLLTFLNGGTSGHIDYHFAPAFMDQFPAGLRDWVLLRDFDQDGFMDLFTAVPQVSNVRVYRNTSSLTGGTLSFALHRDTLVTVYPPTLPLYVSKSDLPAIDDIDGDGDLDILTFQLGGQLLEWHKNLSIENTGGLLGMDFDLQSRCFGHFKEDMFICKALLNQVPCGAGERAMAEPHERDKTALHAGSTTLALDLNNDGLKDLLIGDVGCPTLYSLVNSGTLQVAHFSSTEENYPGSDSSVNVRIFPASFYVDVDNDGIKDLVTAPNNTSESEDVRCVMFHKNAGADALPQFQFQRYGILQEEMIDMGTGAMPTFLDHNGDGLQDLMVGGNGRFDSLIGYLPVLQLFENTGTAQQPAFTQVSADYLGLGNHPAFTGVTGIRPTAGDLDGDGDHDLLLGCSEGTLYYYVNTAPQGSAAAFSLMATHYAGIDVGLASAPQLVDLDLDNDLDLLVGNHRGYIHYYRNTGSVQVPNFVLETDTFGMVKINDFTGQTVSNGYAQPFAVDYDGDGDLDLLVGGIEGVVEVFENIDLTPGVSFPQGSNLFGYDYGIFSSVAGAVLDSARLSYVVGDRRGGLMLLRDSGPVGLNEAASPPLAQVVLFPNPAQTQVFFQILGEATPLQTYAVHDAMGKTVLASGFRGNEGEIDLQGLESGLYGVVFSGKAGHVARRLVIQR